MPSPMLELEIFKCPQAACESWNLRNLKKFGRKKVTPGGENLGN